MNTVRLLIAFILGLISPVVLYYGYKYITTEAITENISSDKLFPASLNIRSNFDHVRISSSEKILPSGDKDFLFAIWYRLLKQPTIGEKSFLAIKYDKDSAKRQGYAIALTKDSEGVRPLVYWMDSSGQGRWHYFEVLDYSPRNWQILVLSVIKGELLGLHAITLFPENSQIKLLGGYPFAQKIYALSDSDLVVGGIKAGMLVRAKIGGFAFIHQARLADNLESHLNKLKIEQSIKSAINSLEVTDSFVWERLAELK